MRNRERKKAWAIVSGRGVIDVDSVRARKSDVQTSIYDDETGARPGRVIVVLEAVWNDLIRDRGY